MKKTTRKSQPDETAFTLFILRHALAQTREEHAGKPDRTRPLVTKGRRKMKKIARHFRALGILPDEIISSPYARAKETAEITAFGLKFNKPIRFSNSLTPDGDPRKLIKELNKIARDGRKIMIVGHEPYLSHLASLLISGETNAQLHLKKSGLCGLKVTQIHNGRCATLELWLPPEAVESKR